MSKGKLEKFAEMETFSNVFQYPYAVISKTDFPLRGRWHDEYFGNRNPIVLELGCGKGEYTVELARRNPAKNFIGIDIKGARMWTGAKQAVEEGLKNVAFLRTQIEFIDRFFEADEVEELWITFPDPQMKNPRKRLTSTWFLQRYRAFLVDNGRLNLKTDSPFLYTYTSLLLEKNGLTAEVNTADLYAEQAAEGATLNEARAVKTYYEQMWLSRGFAIKYLAWRLPRQGTLEEPDVEIPMDDYRSYHRPKRSGSETAK